MNKIVIYPIKKFVFSSENVKWNLYSPIHHVFLPKTHEPRAKINASCDQYRVINVKEIMYFGGMQFNPTILFKTSSTVYTSPQVAYQPKAMK